jgi:hypothetical protein
MSSLILFVLASILSVFGSENQTSVLFQCTECVKSGNSVFAKYLYSALTGAKYSCLQDFEKLSKYSILVDFACDAEGCQDIASRQLTTIYNKSIARCHYEGTYQQSQEFLDPLLYILYVFFLSGCSTLMIGLIIMIWKMLNKVSDSGAKRNCALTRLNRFDVDTHDCTQ